MRSTGCALAILLASAAPAAAEVRGVLRVGVEPLALEPSNDTPVLGGYFDDAIGAYNAASIMYNRAHGYAPGSMNAAATIDRSDLGLHTTMLTLAPGVELGTENVAVRLEALLGFADNHRAFGVGLYPLDLSLPLQNGSVTPYLAAGGTARWLDRTDVDGETGLLISARAALGVRLVGHMSIELGYSLYAAGGVLDTKQLHSMASYDPTGSAPPPQADHVVSGGTQSGMVDISLGVVL